MTTPCRLVLATDLRSVPDALTGLDNVVLTPHIGGRCHERFASGIAQLCAGLAARFAGKPVVAPVPEIAP